MLLGLAQAAAGGVVAARLARGRSRRPPLAAQTTGLRVSVVIPARDEAARIGPCLAGLADDPDVAEVIVVDDRSSDGTADVAREHGARVVAGAEPPAGWIGKPWALQQGLEAAAGDIVVSLDADTRPRPGLVGALAAALAEADLVTASARFVCVSAGERLLHPSMLASLVYRYGPADSPGGRVLSNGQVTAVRRAALLEAGGYALRRLAHDRRRGARARARRRRLARGVPRRHGPRRRADVRVGGRDVARVGPLAGAARRDAGAVAGGRPRRGLADDGACPCCGRSPAGRRASTSRCWRSAPRCSGRWPARTRAAALPFWLSPLADPATAVRLTLSALRPARTWRGRTY